MLLGERRRLTVHVTMRDSDAFTIRDAAWLLEGGGTSEKGTAEIVEHDLRVEVEPKTTGLYQLTVTFAVGTEIIKKRVSIQVAK